MSTGPFLIGAAAAIVVSVSVVSAASDDKPQGRPGSHEVAASTYNATFPSHGPICSASGSSRASTETLNGNPFSSFSGTGAYSAFFFNGSRSGVSGGGGASSQSAGHGQTALVSMPSNGRSPAAAPGASVASPTLGRNPGTAASGTALAQGTTAVGPNATRVALQRSTPSATPEPATLLLLSTGIGGIVLARRRRNRSAD